MCGLFYRPQLAKKSHVELAENVVDQREGLKTWGGGTNTEFMFVFSYRPFHKTLPRSTGFVNRISVRFYETDCINLFQNIQDMFFPLYVSSYENGFIESLLMIMNR